MTGLEKGVACVVAVPQEIAQTWTVPAGTDFGGYAIAREPASEEDVIPLDPETGDYTVTPTEDMDVYVIWDSGIEGT